MSKVVYQELFPTTVGIGTPEPWFSGALSTLGVGEGGGWPDQFGKALFESKKDAKHKQVTAISLFSGAGGLDIGFHDAGFNIVECNEIEPKFAATLHRNSNDGKGLHGSKIVCQDIREYTPSVMNVDFIIGGPPCQTFSAAGARANGVNGTDDDRGNLFQQYARIIDRLQPKGFLFENVYRIVGAQSGKPWKQIQEAFRELGYNLHWRILDAADFGVPQFRERLIIVGLKDGSYKFPYPSHGPDSPDERPYYTAKQAIAGLSPMELKCGIGGRHGYLLDDIPPGLNYSFYTERMGHPNPIFGWRSKFSDYLYKADPETPVRTIKAQGGQYTGPFSWENRPFSSEELKRLQTFPDNYVVEGNRQTVIHQLGNSVPPQFARILALSVLDQVFGRQLPFQIHYMPDHHQLKFRARKSQLTDVYSRKAVDAIAAMPKTRRKPIKAIEGSAPILLTSDFRLTITKGEKFDFSCTYSLNKQGWFVSLVEPGTVEMREFYSINILPPTHHASSAMPWCVPARLVSNSDSLRSVLALWKFYEHLVRKQAAKDDLVQLFGYYQNKNLFRIEMELSSDNLCSSSFWKIVQTTTNGVGVGKNFALSDLAELHGVLEGDLFRALCQMKEIGYEIRNSRTNMQIPVGDILIPYPFPTLNERSLQRLTKLEL